MIPLLNPTDRHDQRAAVANARRFAPGLVDDYKRLIGEMGFPMLLSITMASEGYQAAEPAAKFLQLATLLGAMNEMTEAN